ncbi:MAG: pyrophosphate--fructose-6-phosphate 1-phosphotransferase [Propionibacteriaceae bacterium]|jgi:pyrophosphate--fructose-6-phosphate 1-phosphotransferase|nr:pyrophosphate--fructose-6-phosphate 1-phosphotransferase [Propionibacteriaceae bacterium]
MKGTLMIRKVALLTAGGYAPCLSSAIAALVTEYGRVAPEVTIIGYRHGYEGLLKGDSITFTPEAKAQIHRLYAFGGSPIGNSRVKLTNTADLVKRGLVPTESDPLQVAANQLSKDGVDVLHTIGGDDTNTTAADLAAYLAKNNYPLTVVGLPKTIDNDIVPIKQSLGAWSAADQGAQFAANVIAEHNANSRVLIVHEIMGRNCGYLAAETTRRYRAWLDTMEWLPEVGLSREAWDVHALYIPEMALDISAEAIRLRAVMDNIGCVNMFISEGAGVPQIVAELEKTNADIPRDAFGHIKLDKINPGKWFASQFATLLGARKVQVFKSGYFSRSAASNAEDLDLIHRSAALAVQSALQGCSGVVGMDEEADDRLTTIDFQRIAGHKSFDATQGWYQQLLKEIAQY